MIEFVNAKQIQEIASCGYTKAQEIRKEVNERIEKQGYKVVNYKKAPRAEVIKYLGLEDK